VDSHFGNWSFMGVLNIWDKVLDSKFCSNCVLFRPLKMSKIVDIEVSLHFPFRDLKHKLCSKEWPGVKLTFEF